MESAGIGITKALKKSFCDFSKKEVLIFCGKGNNGGDGLVVARLLFNMKVNVAVFLLEKQVDLKNDTAINAELAFKLGVKITELDKTNLHLLDDHLKNCDIIVDALFGTGLTRPISGLYKQTIEKINKSKKFITAIDIPSGINSDTGILVGDCIRADLTLALALFKHGHLLFPAAALL